MRRVNGSAVVELEYYKPLKLDKHYFTVLVHRTGLKQVIARLSYAYSLYICNFIEYGRIKYSYARQPNINSLWFCLGD